jgi:hypothetical protein
MDMRESTIEQRDSIFIVRLYERVLIKVIHASSRDEAQFISRCWDSGIFSREELDTGL